MHVRNWIVLLAVQGAFVGCTCGEVPIETGVEAVCSEGVDCTGSTCEGDGCLTASCDDATWNGQESDVDCGGPDCPACFLGGGCFVASDCLSGVCVGGQCVAPSCADGLLNAAETDVDCGGPDCAACGDGSTCTVTGDCESGVCNGGRCVAASCSDRVQNGSETDVDCGGGACDPCADGGACIVPGDCQSGVCDGGRCVAATCSDGVQNGSETDVDCGGGDCAPCADAGACIVGGDCQSGVCIDGQCVAATCSDGLQNGSETDLDCGGGACARCADGGACVVSGDCQSGVCDGGQCIAPSCDDGVRNGDETDVDCGGSTCGACGMGGSCNGASDCASGACIGGICSPCSESSECAPGSTCVVGACVPDMVPPSLREAFAPASTTVRVRFSEAMSLDSSWTGATNPANYCIETQDGDASTCTQTLDFSVVGATVVGPDTFDLVLSSASLAKNYTVVVRNVVDLAGNLLVEPSSADFDGNPPLTIISALAIASNRVNVVFSRMVYGGADLAGSAECSSASECAKRYRLIGPSDLGPIVAATRRAAPRENEIILSHTDPQSGATYTIVGANGLDGDGFDNVGFGSIEALDRSRMLSASPGDRASFAGAGAPILGFGDGPISVDPFGDGSTFSYIFKHAGKMNLGPRGNGRGAVRMNGDGSAPEDLAFALEKDLNPFGTTSGNLLAAPFPSVGARGCAKHTYACGPDNEDGRGFFTSGVLDGREWLVIGASRSSGPLSYIYMSPDADRSANLRYVDLSVNRTGNAETFSSMTVSGGRAYLGWPDTGPKRPVLLNLNRTPLLSSKGLDARGNGTGTAPCNPAIHDSCNLMAHLMPGIGAHGSPANTAPVQMVDFFGEFNGRLYLGNNGGIMRATTTSPLDYANAPGHWLNVTPSAAAYGARTSFATSKLNELEPEDRALPQMTVHNGSLFLGRNTTAGPQLWRCDPTIVSGPAPATATDCDPGDWSLVAGNTIGDPLLTQFDNGNNTKIALVVHNGGALFVGFNNAADGIVIFKSEAAAPASLADFTGYEECAAGTFGCAGIGGDGFGTPAINQRIFDAASLAFGDYEYLYVAAGNGVDPVRIYRNRN